MDKKDSKRIIDTYQLISSKISKDILSLIQQDKPIDHQILPSFIHLDKIEYVKALYTEKVQELRRRGQEIIPKNLPFYLIIKEKNPLFSWKIYHTQNDKVNSRNHIIVNIPRIENLRLSLLDLLIRDPIDVTIDTPLHRRYPILKSLPDALVIDLNDLIEKLGIVQPDQATMRLIVAWLQKGLKGEHLTLFAPVCPDYAFEQIGQDLYRYTFSELHSGVGLVARRILDALPFVDAFCKEYRLHINFVIGIADFEALVEENVKRLNLSVSEFLTRLQKSAETIQEESSVRLEVCMITDLCGGHASWVELMQVFKHMFDRNNYGRSGLCQQKLLDIVEARKPLYDQWLGERTVLEDYLPQLLQQGCEYSAMGTLIAQRYTHPLILGADHSAMEPFYHVEQLMPILYLKRVYK